MKTLPAIPNEMILASAGSGKTWQLTNRFIALMGRQLLAGQEVTPERIVAVTFTRKAAGEFFDSILKKLARAASDDDYASALGGDERADPEARDDPLRPVLRQLRKEHHAVLLEVFVRRMPRVFLGTLDSFFSMILRSFPAEFGLAGDFEILDEAQKETERGRVYRRVFQRSGGEEPRAFLDSFRLATFGREESRIQDTLDEFVDQRHAIFLEAAQKERWGDAAVIWPDGCPWALEGAGVGARLETLIGMLEKEGMTESQRSFWDELLEETTTHVPGASIPKRHKWFFEKVLPAWRDVVAGDVQFKVNRKDQHFTGTVCGLMREIFSVIIGAELKVRLERTRGVWAVLDRYERAWSHLVRRRGRLTFQDMQLILAGHEFGAGLPKPLLSQVAGEEARLRIDYRLDARYDHWLLDEFQDTNPFQWAVIENLVDEVVQDTSDERTLFQVGDVKQAIYAWRGGDTRLFEDIDARYNGAGEERVRRRPLNVSWRSGPDVIGMVNRVFGDRSALEAMELPRETVDRWPWQDHQVAGPNAGMPGDALLLNPVGAEGEKPTTDDAFDLVVGLLEEIQPVARGLSCAILVQKNDTGHALLDYIRARTDIPVMSEADIAVATDNALTLALLSLLKVAAHPGDTMAWEHLRMTPFARVIGDDPVAKVAATVLRQIFDEGFEATLGRWMDALIKSGWAPDAFSLRRWGDLALAARGFDQGGSRSVDEFLQFAGHHTAREPDARGAVQIMTLHKSKGLTFDCVILPETGGKTMSYLRPGVGVKRGPRRNVEWVLDLPPKEIVLGDETLAGHRHERESEVSYEALCKLYVALTRARHANYVIAEPGGSSKNFTKLLELTLSGGGEPEERVFGGRRARVLYESQTGVTDPRWFEAHQRAEEEAVVREPGPVVENAPRQRPRRRTPSGSETSIVSARQLFSRGGRFARSYGTLVHGLFEQIEWLDEMTDEALHAAWQAVPCAEESLRTRAVEEVRRSLAEPEVRAALVKPSPGAVCWREKRFEILLNGEWLSGTFDRVVIEPDRATILDFKTDATETEEAFQARVEGYRPQLLTYRQVLSRMTGLPETKIRCRLLFTHRRGVVDI